MQALLNILAASLGRSQATRELAWMQRSPNHSLSLQDMVARRVTGEPLQYILGTQPFGPLNLLSRRPVLIPRPETEHWVLRLFDVLSFSSKIPYNLLDLGTGSGCIPLLLCHLAPPGSLHAHAVDSSPLALALAHDNARLCGIPDSTHPFKPQNTFRTTLANFLDPDFPDAHADIKPPFDIITSNPPYIPWNEYLDLPRSVSAYEDPRALIGGPDGLDYYRAIARLVARNGVLSSSALVALEVGPGQAPAVSRLMRSVGQARHTEIWADPWGKSRTVIARM